MSDDFDLDLLDMNLEDIEELPGFEVPPDGDYLLRMTAEVKEVNDKLCVELAYEVVEAQELKNEDERGEVKAGTKFSQLFFLQGSEKAVKVSKSFLKTTLKDIAAELGQGNLLVLVRDHLKDIMVTATVKRRQKKDDDQVRADVKNLRLA